MFLMCVVIDFIFNLFANLFYLYREWVFERLNVPTKVLLLFPIVLIYISILNASFNLCTLSYKCYVNKIHCD